MGSLNRGRVNYTDLFAVAIMKDDNIVGHVPRKISTVCSLFLCQGGLIICCVIGKNATHEIYHKEVLNYPACWFSRVTPSTWIRPKNCYCLLKGLY